MIFSEFCNIVETNILGFESQYRYLKTLFKVAGIQREYSEDYLKSVYNGIKRFSPNMKKHFIKKDNHLNDVSSFYFKQLNDTSLNIICDAFGIPKKLERKKDFLSYALACQIIKFIKSKDDDVENIVIESYKEALTKDFEEKTDTNQRLYAGDAFWLEKNTTTYNKEFYKVFTHQWIIHNSGKCYWNNRKLVLKNINDIKLSITPYILELDNVKPGGYIKIFTNIEVRGYEGSFLCKWEMQDENNRICFPNSKSFNITVNVDFSSDERNNINEK